MPPLLTTLACAVLLGATTAGTAETSGLEPASPVSTALPASACALGETGTPVSCSCIDLLYGYSDSWLTLLSPADCAGCDVVQLTAAHVWLRWDNIVFDVPVSIRIVGATGEPGSRVPDLSTELCAPVNYVLSPPGLGLHDFALPLPAGCCITGDAFLQVTFPEGISGMQVATSSDYGCDAFFTESGQLINVCSWVCPAGATFCGTNPPVMNVEAECCLPTPTEQRTWGAVKAIYR